VDIPPDLRGLFAAAGKNIMAKCECLETIFSSFQGRRDELIPILQRVQDEFGYLPEDAMVRIARFAGVPRSAVYAVATFYAQFRFTPIGKRHIMVCRGTACHVRGAPRILEKIEKRLGIHEGETTPDREYSLETVACIGACGLSPCITINKQVEAKMTPRKVGELLRKAGDGGPAS
jgi:NADH-quinone oxidoreductase subunit E